MILKGITGPPGGRRHRGLAGRSVGSLKSRRRLSRVVRAGLCLATAGVLVAGCSSSSHSGSSSSPTGKPQKGGVVTFAETASYAPTWILPFYSGEFFTIQEQGWFENLMWPPLYNQANGLLRPTTSRRASATSRCTATTARPSR